MDVLESLCDLASDQFKENDEALITLHQAIEEIRTLREGADVPPSVPESWPVDLPDLQPLDFVKYAVWGDRLLYIVPTTSEIDPVRRVALETMLEASIHGNAFAAILSHSEGSEDWVVNPDSFQLWAYNHPSVCCVRSKVIAGGRWHDFVKAFDAGVGLDIQMWERFV